MLIIGICKIAWKEIFANLYLIGKIIVFPIFFIFTILLIPFSIICFVFFEIPAFILILLTKDGDNFKEKLNFFNELINL